MDHQLSFGRWLKQRRAALDLTQPELARRIAYSVETLRKVEAGRLRPSRELAEKLAEHLAISATEREAFVRFARTGVPLVGGYPAVPLGDADAPLPTAVISAGLPIAPTPIIGREHELAELQSLIKRDDVRLVTLIGPPGVGKTRLALELSHRLRDRFADGIYFVSLAPIRETSLVFATVVHALGIRGTGGVPSIEVLASFLRDKQLLIVLDNVEQVVTAAASLANLLAAVPGLTVLATSRAVLHLRGEHTYVVPPLALPRLSTNAVPNEHWIRDVDRVSVCADGAAEFSSAPSEFSGIEAPAVRLFVDRARSARPGFGLTPDNADAVAAICRRLDGLPLAIELAAAHSRILSPRAILHRLARRLPLLQNGPCDLPDRQRTLAAAIEWSYNLLTPEQQWLFRRLAVFEEGFTLDAAEAVGAALTTLCDDGSESAGQGSGEDVANSFVFECVRTLVDQSMLTATEAHDGTLRFQMLETIREFGLERLADSGEIDRVRRRHARYVRELVEQRESWLRGPRERDGLDQLEADYSNVRAALQYLRSLGDVEEVLRLAAHLGQFWAMRGYLDEGQTWLAWGLERSVDRVSPTWAKAQHGAGVLANRLGDLFTSASLLEEAASVWRQVGDRVGLAWSLAELGYVVHRQCEFERADRLYRESLDEFRSSRTYNGAARVLIRLGVLAQERQDVAGASAVFEEALTLSREAEDMAAVSEALNSLAGVEAECGQFERAEVLYEDALAIKRNLGDVLGIAFTYNGLANLALERREYDRAVSIFDNALSITRRMGDRGQTPYLLYELSLATYLAGDRSGSVKFARESIAAHRSAGCGRDLAQRLGGWAAAVHRLGNVEAATWLLGAVAGLDDVRGLAPRDRARQDRILADARAVLPFEILESAWASGRSAPLDDVVERALTAGSVRRP